MQNSILKKSRKPETDGFGQETSAAARCMIYCAFSEMHLQHTAGGRAYYIERESISVFIYL